jgi:hypothetical protein
MDFAVVLAHGTANAGDAPIPLSYAIVGALVALYASFDVMRTRTGAPKAGRGPHRAVPRWVAVLVDAPAARALQRLAGLAAAVATAVIAVSGPREQNPAGGLVYSVFWAGLVPASLLLGPVWRRLNPLRTLHALVATATGRRAGFAELPARVGYWPAAAGLLAFVWLELVWPAGDQPGTLYLWFLGYAVVQVTGAVLFGPAWFDRADAFDVLSTLVGRLAPIGRDRNGTLVLRRPLAGLTGTAAEPGLIALTGVLLGSTMFDSMSAQTLWRETAPPTVPAATVGLVAVVLLVTTATVVAVRAGFGRGRDDRRLLPARLAASLIPVAAGYHVAHYLSLLLRDGPDTVVLAAGVMTAGHAAEGGAASTRPAESAALWVVQVLAIVAGHVAGVITAHRHGDAILGSPRAARAHLPLLLLMMTFTVAGLLLLYRA